MRVVLGSSAARALTGHQICLSIPPIPLPPAASCPSHSSRSFRRPHTHSCQRLETPAWRSGSLAAAAQPNNPGGGMVLSAEDDPRVQEVLSSIRGIPDFPKQGIYFYDITTLLLNPTAFQHVIDMFSERYQGQKVDVIAGFEARGFLFGPPLALRLGVPFVPLRKPGKLPGKTLKATYDLEYGSDAIEVHEDAIQRGQRVVLVDDLVATGGTLAAGVKLMGQMGAEVVEAAAILELQELKGRDKLPNTRLHALAVVSEYGPGGLPGGDKH